MAKLTDKQKWMLALYIAILFLLISSPVLYRITNRLTSALGWQSSSDGCPSVPGLILHGVVFFFLTRAILSIPDKDY